MANPDLNNLAPDEALDKLLDVDTPEDLEKKIIKEGDADTLVRLIAVCNQPDTINDIGSALVEHYKHGRATVKHLADAVDAEAERYGFFFTDCDEKFCEAIEDTDPRDLETFETMIQPTIEMLVRQKLEDELESSAPGM